MVVRDLKYRMGFQVNGSPIPDPSVFSGRASALDSSAGRDANGTLHRAMVTKTPKRPVKLEYHEITYAQMRSIMTKMTAASFKFTFPDPVYGSVTIKAYVGDREWDVHQAREAVEADSGNDNAGEWKHDWLGDLKFSVIEY